MYVSRYNICNRWEDERDLHEEALDEAELHDLLSALKAGGGYDFRVEAA